MKKLHLISSGKNSLRPTLDYLQVKNGYLYATDCHKLAKIPVTEVFGPNIGITPEDHFYIKSSDWKQQNFFKAEYIKWKLKDKDTQILEAYDKKYQKIGMLEIIDELNFFNKVGKFPDCESVLPANEKPAEAVDLISFNPSYLQDLCEVFNQSSNNFIYTFFGKTKAIKVTHKDMEGFGILMPIAIHD